MNLYFLFQLSNPTSKKPALKFGTVPFTHTDSLLRKHHPEMYSHMTQFFTKNVSEGVANVREA
jgi:ionotropic glutamate receptor NMDA 2B